jgi:hypothetical protein
LDTAAARAELMREYRRIAASLGQTPQCGEVLLDSYKAEVRTRADVRTWSSQGYELSVAVWTGGLPPEESVRLIYALGAAGDDHPHVSPRECTEADRVR